MTYKLISSSDAKYLAATDILIGDMSDINYEYLLFNRPIILLSNEWIRQNFPDIGIKTNLSGLHSAIEKSLDNPEEYEANRIEWLERTINFPENKTASKHILDLSISNSGFSAPVIFLLHGNNSTRKTNLIPLYDEAVKNNIEIHLIDKPFSDPPEQAIYIAAHFADLNIDHGYVVHLDHGLKGQGTAMLEIAVNDYKAYNHFPHIHLHITAGKEGWLRTKNLLLGPFSDRAVIGAYPKADALIKLNTTENRREVCKELEFNPDYPIVTYAPSGPLSYQKPGGSLNYFVIRRLKKIAGSNNFNVMVKLKNKKHNLIYLPLRKLSSMYLKYIKKGRT